MVVFVLGVDDDEDAVFCAGLGGFDAEEAEGGSVLVGWFIAS